MPTPVSNSSAPQCFDAAKDAAKGGALVGVGVLGTLAGAATGGPLGFAAGLAGLFVASEDEGEKLRHLYDCKAQ